MEVDARGYLLRRDDWTRAWAIECARADQINLTAEHWEIIGFLQDYFEQYELALPMRLLVKEVRQNWGPEKGNSRYLYRLFPEGPAKQASKYAGLPRPMSCI